MIGGLPGKLIVRRAVQPLPLLENDLRRGRRVSGALASESLNRRASSLKSGSFRCGAREQQLGDAHQSYKEFGCPHQVLLYR